MARGSGLDVPRSRPVPRHGNSSTRNIHIFGPEGLHNNRGNRFAEWLAADQGFTLIRRERMLMCLSLKDGLPDGAIPRVTPEELTTRDDLSLSVCCYLWKVVRLSRFLEEIKPLLGTYGKAESLPQTQQISGH